MTLPSRLTLSLFVLFATLTVPSGPSAAQGPKGTAPAGPMLWTAYIENTFGFAQNATGPITPSLISSFTPFNALTIVRIEASALQGPVFYHDQYGIVPPKSCSVPPSLQVTDGASTQTLVFAQGEKLISPTSADSGPISMAVPADRQIRLMFVPGSPNTPYIDGFCLMDSINIVVQYKAQ